MDWLDNAINKLSTGIDHVTGTVNAALHPSEVRVRLYLDELLLKKICAVRHNGHTYRITIEEIK